MMFHNVKSERPEIGKRVLVEVLDRLSFVGEHWYVDVGTYDGRESWTVRNDPLAIVRSWAELPVPGPRNHSGDPS
jgi:hypothetical protein